MYGRSAPTSLVCPATLQLPIEFTTDQPACAVKQVIEYILYTQSHAPARQLPIQFTTDKPPCAVNQVIEYILYTQGLRKPTRIFKFESFR